MSGTEPDLPLCLQVAEQIARQAGKYILEGFHSTKNIDTKRGPWDLVTEYDRGAENTAVSELKKKFPSHKFIGEESEAGKLKSTELTDDPTWIIDPIDGTTNFVHGFHEICISIGLSVNKEPVVGVIYNPVMDHMYTARKGNGAYFNGQRIYSSKCTDIRQTVAVVEVSVARVPEVYDTTIARLEEMTKIIHGFRTLGSAAMILCYLAKGNFDVFQMDYLECWDVAAGAVILQEAGGTALHTSGAPFDVMSKKYLFAGNDKLAEQLVEIIKRADARCEKE